MITSNKVDLSARSLNCGAKGVNQVLRNEIAGGEFPNFQKNPITKVYCSTLLALPVGWVHVKFPEKSVR